MRSTRGYDRRFALRAALAVAVALSFALLSLSGPSAADKQPLPFFDPDANHQAIASIKTWVDTYLDERGTLYFFQPVKDVDALKKVLEQSKPPYAIVSGAVAKDFVKNQKARVLLVPKAGGSIYYTKKLVDRKAPGQPFAAKTIAAAIGEASGPQAAQLLRTLSAAGLPVTGTVVISVAKDIDALLALTFGQVDAAIVTQQTIDLVAKLNPAASAKLRQVYETPQIIRPPLITFTPQASSGEASLVDAFLSMERSEVGRKAVKALGFDGWTRHEQGGLQ